jgi:hypothetical protein
MAERVAVFTSALERIGRVSGPGRSLRHGTLEERSAFLRRYGEDQAFRARYRARARGLTLAVLALGAGALALTAARLPANLVRGRVVLSLEEADRLAESSRPREGATPEAREAARRDAARARDLFLRAAETSLAEDDVERRFLAAQALASAADLALRRLDRPDDARREYERALAIVDDLPAWTADEAAGLRFHASADLGLLALRAGGAGVEEARRRLAAAGAVEDVPLPEDVRSARLRLLDAASRMGDADPARAAAARREVEALAGAPDDPDLPGWQDVRDDARAVLAESPPSE